MSSSCAPLAAMIEPIGKLIISAMRCNLRLIHYVDCWCLSALQMSDANEAQIINFFITFGLNAACISWCAPAKMHIASNCQSMIAGPLNGARFNANAHLCISAQSRIFGVVCGCGLCNKRAQNLTIIYVDRQSAAYGQLAFEVSFG